MRRALLLVFLLAGCTQPTPQADLPAIDWQPMAVSTTAVEPFEFRGYLRVAWADGGFALEAEMEPDLATKTLRLGDRVFTTILERGWTEYTIEEAVDGHISNRLLLWDLRGLYESPDMEWRQEGTTLTGEGAIHYDGAARAVNATFSLDGDRIVYATVASRWGRESPFTFTPGPAPEMPFAQPQPVRLLAEVQANEPVARDGHAQIVTWLIEHEKNRGTVPDRVDADSLAVEMAVSGGQWPTNPYDQQPVAGGGTGGHFTWTKCGPGDGEYEGFGWDRTLLGYAFGRGCA